MEKSPTKPADSVDGIYNRIKILIVLRADLWTRAQASIADFVDRHQSRYF